MFECRKLRKLDISDFETPNLINANMIFGGDHLDYVDMKNFDSSNYINIFEISYICKLTIGSKLINQYFPQPLTGEIFDNNGINRVSTG